MKTDEYRIVKYLHPFFSHYAYRLEVKRQGSFLLWKGEYWEKVAGNSLTTEIEPNWYDFNIVEEIIEKL